IFNEGTLSLYRSTIQYSQTDGAHSGGAIATTGPVTIDQSTLTHNLAGSGGALIAAAANARVFINQADVDHNQAVGTFGRGGAIRLATGAGATIAPSHMFNYGS